MLICLPHGTEMQEEFQTSVLCYNYCGFLQKWQARFFLLNYMTGYTILLITVFWVMNLVYWCCEFSSGKFSREFSSFFQSCFPARILKQEENPEICPKTKGFIQTEGKYKNTSKFRHFGKL